MSTVQFVNVVEKEDELEMTWREKNNVELIDKHTQIYNCKELVFLTLYFI